MGGHYKFEQWVRSTFGDANRPHEDEWVVDCPMCGSPKRFAMNPEKRLWRCFREGTGGRLAVLLVSEYGLTYTQADALLEDRIDLADLPEVIQRNDQQDQLDEEVAAYQREEMLSHLVPLDEDHRRFIDPFAKGRGFSFDIFQSMGFRYGFGGAYSSRVIIPAFNDQGELGYFQARSLYGEQPPYKNPPRRVMDKGSSLFNLVAARYWVQQGYPLYVCEGAFNAMSIGGNAIATFGKDLTEGQRTAIQTQLLPYCRSKVVIAFDFAADTQAMQLQVLTGARRIVMADKRDLNDWYRSGGVEAVQWILNNWEQ